MANISKIKLPNDSNTYNIVDNQPVVKNIPNTPCDIATFTDGANLPMSSLKVGIEPQQDLHGYDHPWVGGAGKNKINITLTYIKSINKEGTWNGNTYTFNGLTYEFEANQDDCLTKITVNGTASTGIMLRIYYGLTYYSNGTYIVSGVTGGSDDTYQLEFVAKNYTRTIAASGENTLVANNILLVELATRKGVTVSNLVVQPMVRLSTEDSTFAPYSNICPISGRTGCNPSVCGVNLFNVATKVSGYISNSTGKLVPNQHAYSSDWIPVKGNTEYYIKTNPDLSADWGAWYDKDKNFITGVTGYKNRTKTSPPNAFYARFTVGDGNQPNDFSFNYPSTDTSYYAYNGQTYNIQFTVNGETKTIYSGYVEVINGKVKAVATDENIASYNGETLPSTWISDRDVYAEGTTPTIGAQVVYKLATPIEYDLSDVSILSQNGENNVLADTGKIEEGSYVISKYSGMTATVANYAGSATKATQDESGNNIKSSYASSISIADHTITLKNKNGTSLGTVTVPDNATDNTKLPLAGGTMTGQIVLASNGYKTSNTGGYTLDQYGNFKHQSSDTSQYWNIQNNAGTNKFSVYWETGNVTAAGTITASKFVGVNEADLKWGGANFAGSYGCIDAALMDELGANRFQFIKASAITVEYSRDGGSTWTDYGATDAQKQQIFAQGGGLIIGKADSTHKATEHPGQYQLRITIDTGVAGVYSYLNKFIIYVSTSGSANCVCKIQKALQSTPTAFVDHTDWISVTGWSGYNVLNTSNLPTYGNSPSGQYGRVRFIFKDGEGGSTNYIGLSVLQIKAFGGVGWICPSTMAKTGHLYSYNENQTAVFPNAVYATALYENNVALSSKYFALSGGTITGVPKFGSGSISAFSGNIPYILGIEAFADGGTVKWKASSDVTVGSATTASKLGSSTVGSATQPIYLNGGTATACTYTLGKSVPSDAVFTDHYAWTDITGKPSSYTPTSHTHGNIQNGGTLQTNDITIASGDKLVVTDSSDSSKVARTSISFDGSTATKALTQKGTWETFGTSNLTIGTTSSTAMAGNTNVNNVTQTATDSASSDYEILFSGTGDNTTRTEGVRKTSALKYNPSVKALNLSGANNSLISIQADDGNDSDQIQYNTSRNYTYQFQNNGIFTIYDNDSDNNVFISDTSISCFRNDKGVELKNISEPDIVISGSTWDGTNTSLKNTIGSINSNIGGAAMWIGINTSISTSTNTKVTASYIGCDAQNSDLFSFSNGILTIKKAGNYFVSVTERFNTVTSTKRAGFGLWSNTNNTYVTNAVADAYLQAYETCSAQTIKTFAANEALTLFTNTSGSQVKVQFCQICIIPIWVDK